MKALFISNDPKVFDSESAVRMRMRAYAAAIGELHIISYASRTAREEKEGNLFLYPVTAPKPFHFYMMVRKARAVIRARAVDVVSAQDPFEHGWIALRAVRETRAKLHIQVHTDFLSPYFSDESWKNKMRVHSADRVLLHARGIRVVSERIKKSLVARYGNRIPEPAVIPIAVSAEVPPAIPLPAHSYTFTLFAVSRLEPEKRLQDVFHALAIVRKKYPGVGLFIAGRGGERTALIRCARALHIEDAVVFLGWRDDYKELMQSADAFIQASAYEGYGITLIDAALAKVPIITTDVGIMGDVLMPLRDALVSRVSNPAALAASIESLITDPALRTSLAAHAEVAARSSLAAAEAQPARIADDLARTLA